MLSPSLLVQREAEAQRKVYVVLSLLLLDRVFVHEGGAVDVVVRGNVEAEEAAQVESYRGSNHSPDVSPILEIGVSVSAPFHQTGARIQTQPDRAGPGDDLEAGPGRSKQQIRVGFGLVVVEGEPETART